MTVKEFTLPDVGEGVAEGELVTWLVAPGDRVEEDQPVAEVETDKALVEVPSRYDGVVEELFVEEGDVVPVGDVIISFRVDEGEESDGESAAAAGGGNATEESDDTPESDVELESDAELESDGEPEPAVAAGRTFAPPSARRLARELGVEIDAVDGSGPGGRVTEADVRTVAESGSGNGDGDAVVGDRDEAPTPRSDPGHADERKTAVTKRSGEKTTGIAEAAPEPADRETTLATPATRKVARDRGVDVDDVPTEETRDGEAFVTEADVRAYADALEASEATGETGVTGSGEETASPRAVDFDATASATVGASAGDSESTKGTVADATAETAAEPAETIPYRGVRRTIGKQMERSKYTAPHVTHHDTVRVDRLVEARERLKPAAEERGVRLTYMPFVMKAIVAGLKEYPVLNSELREDDEEIVLKREYNLGIAVATDAGLMVPVVEDVDEKGLFELADEIADLAARARDRTLKPGEMKGGTFSVTNFGAIGGEYATPIINYPETAIVGLGAIEERPVVRERDGGGVGGDGAGSGDAVGRGSGSEVVAAPTLPLSLSIDHRVVDGAVAAEFANTVMEHLEHPLLLLNEQW
ncbi:dihydrolipoamide acetyltransferase family protein [Halorubrum pallidum]